MGLMALFCGHAVQISQAIPESAMFNHLITVERRVDVALQRKRSAATAALAMPQTAQRKIRLYVFSTHTGQQSPSDAAGAHCLELALTLDHERT